MNGVVVAVDAPEAVPIVDALVQADIPTVTRMPAAGLADAADGRPEPQAAGVALGALRDSDTLVLQVRRDTISPALVSACDRHGVRIVALCAAPDDIRLAELYGLAEVLRMPLAPEAVAAAVRDPVASSAAAPRARGRVIAVWGPGGAPGRTTVAIEVAVELARLGRRVALVDADTHAPAVALALGLADEGPGFAAACRQVERDALPPAELARIAVPLGGGVDVLVGINRPSRWPELSADRVTRALDVCRDWADDVVVDVAASLERDEEIVSDLDGPRRNAATLSALRSADVVLAVAAADPIGIARFVRGWSELRATIGATPVIAVVNRLRPGPVGVDARGQVRTALERFCGIRDPWFLPQDARAADAAVLAARPIGEIAARSALSAGIRRIVVTAIAPGPAPAASRRRSRSRRPARARRGAPLV